MHKQIGSKIKALRILKGLKGIDMAEKLNLTLSAYSRLEAGTSLTWGKYFLEILAILQISPKVFFEDMDSNGNISNSKPNANAGNLQAEKLYAETKEKSEQLTKLYETRIEDLKTRNTELEGKVNRKDLKIESLKAEILSLKGL